MKKKLILFLGFIAQLFNLSAQTSIPKSTQEHTVSNSLLWRISGKKITHPSYLFGTIHAICNEDFFFTPKMDNALQSCQKLILEIDLTSPSMIEEYQEHMMLPEGKELKNFFQSEEEYKTFVHDATKLLGMDIEPFTKLKPFLLLSMFAMKADTCDNQTSYEMTLVDKSKPLQMKVEGLETTTSQLEIFEKMSDADMRLMLLESVKNDVVSHKEQEAMIRLYKAQNIDSLYNTIISSPEFKGHEDAMLFDRNKKWVPILENSMHQNACFVAVGAGHLAGEKGVLELLRKKGYTVEAVR